MTSVGKSGICAPTRSRRMMHEKSAGTGKTKSYSRILEPRMRATSVKRRTASRAGAFIAMLAVFFGFMIASSPEANAAAIGCVGTRFGSLCNSTAGSGLRVVSVRASLTRNPWWLCNKEFNVRGTLYGGRNFDRSAVAKCGVGQVYVDFHINMDFQNNTLLCVGVKEYGGANPWEPYYACNRIWYR